MDLIKKPFIKKLYELSSNELYEILKARIAVFIVEQNCPYQDIDDYDKEALHITLPYKDKLGAYCRVIPAGIKDNYFHIGRFLTLPHARKKKLGHKLIEIALEEIKKHDGKDVKISAQVYIKEFYSSHGFASTGKEYLEDNIPHVDMIWSN